MRTMMFLSLVSLSVSAMAVDVPKACYKKAAVEVAYEGEEALAFNCELSRNKAAVVCNVAAYKGGGDATDEYVVVLTKDCRKVLRTELVAEE